ncbi:MAG: hypothetical protein ACYDGN_08320 [Acidimicrobiales bacterium]
MTARALAPDGVDQLELQLPSGDRAEVSSSRRRAVRLGLAVYGLSRLFLLSTAGLIEAIDHLSASIVLRSWDGKYYMYIARHGYPTTLRLKPARPDAFFPLFPMMVRALHFLTGLAWLDSGVLASWIAGAALVVLGALLAGSIFDSERAVQATLLLAVFPGSVVAGLPYADPLGLACSAACLLALQRKRFFLAGVAGMAATASFSLVLGPLLAVCLWLLVANRQLKVIVTAGLTTLGAALYVVYLWIHVGTPLIWWRLQRTIWHSHLGLSIERGTTWAIRATWGSFGVTTACLVVAVTGLVLLRRYRAPVSWLIFTSTIFAITIFDTGTWLTARLAYAMFPGVLAIGARIPKEWTVPMVVVSMLGLCLCLAIYAPQNWYFFNP